MMLSECARTTTAQEARFRVDYPNSKPRSVKVIALDPPSERVVKRIARSPWNSAAFFTSLSQQDAPRAGNAMSVTRWLGDLAGRTKDLVDEIASADLVVIVAAAGENADAASVIGEACGVKRVMLTALILGGGASDEALSHTLAYLRPFASMLVIASAEEYIADMLAALRA
jgi:hypothetical protein